jgi:hypothetical protein
MPIEKIKILGVVLSSYQLNSIANSAHFAHFVGKLAGLAVLSSW